MTHVTLLKTGMFLVSALANQSSAKPADLAIGLLKQFATSKNTKQEHPEFQHCGTCHEANVRLLKQA